MAVTGGLDPLGPIRLSIPNGNDHIFCCGPTCLATLPEPGSLSEYRGADAHMCRTGCHRLFEIRTHPC